MLLLALPDLLHLLDSQDVHAMSAFLADAGVLSLPVGQSQEQERGFVVSVKSVRPRDGCCTLLSVQQRGEEGGGRGR